MISRVEVQLMQAMVAEFQSVDGGGSSRANLLRAITLLSLKGWHQTTFIEATRMIESAIEQEPDLALSHAYLALLKALGQLERALPMLKKAIDLDSQNGQAKTALRESDNALEAAENACKEDDRLYLPRLTLAAAHLVRKEQDRAVAAVRECLRTKPDLNREEVTSFFGPKPYTAGDGMGHMANTAVKAGVQFFFNTPASQLVQSKSGEVVGVSPRVETASIQSLWRKKVSSLQQEITRTTKP